MAHPVEHVLDRAGLHRLARIHDGDAVAGLEDQPEIVRHEDHRRAEFLAEPLDQLDDAGLDGHVERRRRLVEQQQRRLRQQRHGDDDALLLATRQLVRIGAHHALGVRQAHGAHRLQRALVGLFLRHLVVQDRHFHQLLADLHGRVQAGHRLLVDHGDLVAADGAQLLRRQLAHVLAFELDRAADDLSDVGEVAHDAERHGRLAAAGFADDAHRLARLHRAGKVHDGRYLAAAREERDGQVLDFEDRCCGIPDGLVHGNLHQSFIDCSRSASARRLRPSTNDISAKVGGSAGWMNERSSRLASLIAVPQSGLSGARPRPK